MVGAASSRCFSEQPAGNLLITVELAWPVCSSCFLPSNFVCLSVSVLIAGSLEVGVFVQCLRWLPPIGKVWVKSAGQGVV